MKFSTEEVPASKLVTLNECVSGRVYQFVANGRKQGRSPHEDLRLCVTVKGSKALVSLKSGIQRCGNAGITTTTSYIERPDVKLCLEQPGEK